MLYQCLFHAVRPEWTISAGRCYHRLIVSVGIDGGILGVGVGVQPPPQFMSTDFFVFLTENLSMLVQNFITFRRLTPQFF